MDRRRKVGALRNRRRVLQNKKSLIAIEPLCEPALWFWRFPVRSRTPRPGSGRGPAFFELPAHSVKRGLDRSVASRIVHRILAAAR
jgi:hypothetical protein